MHGDPSRRSTIATPARIRRRPSRARSRSRRSTSAMGSPDASLRSIALSSFERDMEAPFAHTISAEAKGVNQQMARNQAGLGPGRRYRHADGDDLDAARIQIGQLTNTSLRARRAGCARRYSAPSKPSRPHACSPPRRISERTPSGTRTLRPQTVSSEAAGSLTPDFATLAGLHSTCGSYRVQGCARIGPGEPGLLRMAACAGKPLPPQLKSLSEPPHPPGRAAASRASEATGDGLGDSWQSVSVRRRGRRRL